MEDTFFHLNFKIVLFSLLSLFVLAKFLCSTHLLACTNNLQKANFSSLSHSPYFHLLRDKLSGASGLNQGEDKAEANFLMRKNTIAAGGRRKL